MKRFGIFDDRSTEDPVKKKGPVATGPIMVQTRLNPDDYKKLVDLAYGQGASLSTTIRKLIIEYVNSQAPSSMSESVRTGVRDALLDVLPQFGFLRRE
jgi:hypothetical protein